MPNIRVAPPRMLHEWKQLAAIEVKVFDDHFQWWEFRERKATERFVRQHYVDTAKRLQGNKYALFVAMESQTVVGMVEMGVSRDDERNATQTTIGVLCVSPNCQQRGVGAMLLEKCERVATSEGWNETILYTEVEPNNTAALHFFQKYGFASNNETRNVMVRRRRMYEERPHLLLFKDLSKSESRVDSRG